MRISLHRFHRLSANDPHPQDEGVEICRLELDSRRKARTRGNAGLVVAASNLTRMKLNTSDPGRGMPEPITIPNKWQRATTAHNNCFTSERGVPAIPERDTNKLGAAPNTATAPSTQISVN